MLKEALTTEGMTLSTWLQFVNELSGELKSENLVQVLAEGAEVTAIDNDERPIQAMRDQVAHAAVADARDIEVLRELAGRAGSYTSVVARAGFEPATFGL